MTVSLNDHLGMVGGTPADIPTNLSFEAYLHWKTYPHVSGIHLESTPANVSRLSFASAKPIPSLPSFSFSFLGRGRFLNMSLTLSLSPPTWIDPEFVAKTQQGPLHFGLCPRLVLGGPCDAGRTPSSESTHDPSANPATVIKDPTTIPQPTMINKTSGTSTPNDHQYTHSVHFQGAERRPHCDPSGCGVARLQPATAKSRIGEVRGQKNLMT